jgi:hypothetical protein
MSCTSQNLQLGDGSWTVKAELESCERPSGSKPATTRSGACFRAGRSFSRLLPAPTTAPQTSPPPLPPPPDLTALLTAGYDCCSCTATRSLEHWAKICDGILSVSTQHHCTPTIPPLHVTQPPVGLISPSRIPHARIGQQRTASGADYGVSFHAYV